VVNDRFSKREAAVLPRRMRNILKQRICIGCYKVCIEFSNNQRDIKVEPHKRTQSVFWQKLLSTSLNIKKENLIDGHDEHI
jgi:hypothetical protein